MELKFARPSSSHINQIRFKARTTGSPYRSLSKFSELDQYTDEDIRAMYNGFFMDTQLLITDGDYVLHLKDVVRASCVLVDVSYYKKPSLKDYETNAHNEISNIRTFYVKNYFLHTNHEVYGNTRHEITGRLVRAGAFSISKGKNRSVYSIANTYKCFQRFANGSFPKDLFHPIKLYINDLFFENVYHIDDFVVETKIDLNK